VADDPHHLRTLAYEIREQIKQSTEEKRRRVFEYHEEECGVEIVLPRMKKLFSLLLNHKVADREVLHGWIED
jgi:hypothetical protein